MALEDLYLRMSGHFVLFRQKFVIYGVHITFWGIDVFITIFALKVINKIINQTNEFELSVFYNPQGKS